MEGTFLRQSEEKDEKAVYDLHVAGLKQSESYIADPSSREELDKDLKNIKESYIDNGGEFLVLTTTDNEIIGMGGLRKIDDTTSEIKRMRVNLGFQGKGLGSLILDKLIEKAKELGYKKLILDTALKQKVAQHLYESRGFKESNRGEVFGQETIYYELEL